MPFKDCFQNIVFFAILEEKRTNNHNNLKCLFNNHHESINHIYVYGFEIFCVFIFFILMKNLCLSNAFSQKNKSHLDRNHEKSNQNKIQIKSLELFNKGLENNIRVYNISSIIA